MPKAQTHPYNRAVAITKSDTVNIDGTTETQRAANPSGTVPADAIYVGTAGVVVVILSDGSVVPFTCIAGALLPVAAVRINSTNTVPTLMNALYFV
jgi:hypothetical protein